MSNTCRALTESFFLHGLLVGAMIFMAGMLTSPPKIIRLDFSLREQTAATPTPPKEEVVAVPSSPIVQHPSAQKPRPKVTAKTSPKKQVPVLAATPPEVAAIESESSPPPEADVPATTDTNTAQASSGPATQNTAASAGEDYRRANFTAIRNSILANLHYPMVARRQGWCGKVEVAFVIKQDGHISELRIEKSSGYAVLDEQALDAIRRSAPFAPPRIAALLVMPVTFQLN